MSLYCLFIARKSSKRIKNKNFIKIKNRPIIYYPIKTAQKSNLFKDIYLSTDSLTIKKYIEKIGVKAPFLRKKKFSGDNVQIPEVIRNFFSETKKLNFKKNDIFVFIYSTNIFLKSDDLKKAISKFINQKLDYLVGVQKYSANPYRSFTLKKGFLKPTSISFYLKKSQDLEDHYFHPGSFFIFREFIFKNKKFKFPKKTGYFLHKKNDYIDIDDAEDLSFALKIFKTKKL